jgi:hypothetical protein
VKKNRRWLGKRAKKIRYSGAEPMAGGSRRGFTWHDEGLNRKCGGSGSHDWLAKYVNDKRIPYHAIYCPFCGDIIQMIDFAMAARSMVGGDVDGHGNSANKAGAVNIQVCIAGMGPGRQLTDTPMKNIEVFGALADSWGIPHRVRGKWGPGASRDRSVWMKGGIQGHCHGPNDTHVDHKMDPKKLKAAMWPQRRRRRK